MTTHQPDQPDLLVESDYDGYFEAIVAAWIEQHEGPFTHQRIVVTAGPWRSAAVSFEKDGTTLHLDFYSALRAGFGGLSSEDVRQLVAML
jgi:predicted SpoU family rRNA methylase